MAAPIQLSLQSLHATFTVVAPQVQANAISEEEFYSTYDPQKKETGDLFDFDDVKDLPAEFVWSVMETGDELDQNWYASPGFHRVNVLGYVTSKRPCVNWDLEAVYFDADDSEREGQLGEETIKALQFLQGSGQTFTVEFDRESFESLIKWDTAARLEYSMRPDDDEEIAGLRNEIDTLANLLQEDTEKRLAAVEDPEERQALEEKIFDISGGLAVKIANLEAVEGLSEKAALHAMVTAMQTAYLLFGAL